MGLGLDFIPRTCGSCGPYMDFPTRICGPYGPYMVFLPESIDSEVHIQVYDLLRGKVIEDFEISNFGKNIQNFQMSISAMSTRPKFKIWKILQK